MSSTASSNPEMSSSFQEKSELFSKLDFLRWLDNESPCFPVDGDKVTVLKTPEEFYQTLISKTEKSTKRIVFASLYLGTGSLEKKLVDSVEKNLKEKSDEEKPRVQILLDATRGSRGSQNSRKMLLNLLQNFSENVSVHMYHTPALRGLMKTLIPERYNETIGLQHMKIYLFDNSLLISGANLSNDYFTNRQDRYVLIEDCGRLADFYDKLVNAVCDFSLKLNAEDQLRLSSSSSLHPYESDRKIFATDARDKVASVMNTFKTEEKKFEYSSPKDRDTWVFPLIQMGQLGITMDSSCTSKILGSIPKNAELSLASGYFNLTQEYMDSILHSTEASTHILMAHPTANGFLGAPGFAGAIPSAYTHIAATFFHQVRQSGQSARIRLWEYQRNLWTFHAKGLWISFQGSDTKPFFTLVGSPNFGYRSVYRDLETQIAVVTVNPRLREQLREERENLFGNSEIVSLSTYALPQRQVPLWVRLVIRVIKHFF
nr:EOG090X08SX [Eulimnadia texana]